MLKLKNLLKATLLVTLTSVFTSGQAHAWVYVTYTCDHFTYNFSNYPGDSADGMTEYVRDVNKPEGQGDRVRNYEFNSDTKSLLLNSRDVVPCTQVCEFNTGTAETCEAIAR